MLRFLFIKKELISFPSVLKELQKQKKISLIHIEEASTLSPEDLKDITAILVLGGDGTFLRAVPYAYKYDLPILGVNMGNFGFLTETYINEVPETLDALKNKKIKFEERNLLKITYENQSFVALNEGAIMKGTLGKIIYLTLKIENTEVTTIYGDGLIISTPTGSTAYNLSAGGPIVHPDSKVFICTPICSFKINMKPFIIPDYYNLEIILEKKKQSKNEEVHLLIDGQTNLIIKENEPLRFQKAEKTLKIIPSIKRNYFQILKSKFHW